MSWSLKGKGELTLLFYRWTHRRQDKELAHMQMETASAAKLPEYDFLKPECI